jgi:hypothetical protein
MCSLSHKNFLIFILFGVITACNNYPETPEEVIEAYTNALSNGDCEKAMDFCGPAVKEAVQASIDAGCDTYETRVDSVTCIDEGTHLECTCFETRTVNNSNEPYMHFEFPYQMEEIDGKWIIASSLKDHPDWEDDYPDFLMESESGALEYTLDLEKTEFALGENIVVTLTVTNYSAQELSIWIDGGAYPIGSGIKLYCETNETPIDDYFSYLSSNAYTQEEVEERKTHIPRNEAFSKEYNLNSIFI